MGIIVAVGIGITDSENGREWNFIFIGFRGKRIYIEIKGADTEQDINNYRIVKKVIWKYWDILNRNCMRLCR